MGVAPLEAFSPPPMIPVRSHRSQELTMVGPVKDEILAADFGKERRDNGRSAGGVPLPLPPPFFGPGRQAIFLTLDSAAPEQKLVECHFSKLVRPAGDQ